MLDRLREPIRDELARFRESYRQTLLSGHKAVDRVVSHLVRSHGKGLRPILTLLCARMGSHEVSDDAITAAVIVELLHEATLVHDDVVDEASERRGFPSLPARFRNKVAVLFGDYMLATVLTRTLSVRDLRWLDILSVAARRMARGELMQAARARRMDMNQADYLAMIGDKTAALFSACCSLGGLTGGLGGEVLDSLEVYGERLGIAFQIRDDMLDLFGDGRGIGKPVGGDLRERKLTLPLIAALSRVDGREARRIKARIRRGVRRGEVGIIAGFVRRSGGESYAGEVMLENAARAVEALQGCPPSTERKLLEDLVEFTMDREA